MTRRSGPKAAPRTSPPNEIKADSTPERLDDHERRITNLEGNARRRKPPTALANDNGETVWLQGSGWVRRTAAA